MHQTPWSFDVLDRAPKSCFARKEHGGPLVPTQFKSTIRSTTNPSPGCSGLRPRMERQLVTPTMASGFSSAYQKARYEKSPCSIERAPVTKRRSSSPDWTPSGKELQRHVNGRQQQTKCHRENDRPRWSNSLF